MDREDAHVPHVAIFPSPGMGHLIPLLELGSRLHLHHGLSSTLLVDHSHRDEPILRSLPTAVSAHLLPLTFLDDLPASAKMETRICLSVTRNLPNVRSFLAELKQSRKLRLVALVVDLFTAEAVDVARELDISVYVFFPPSATTLSLFLHLPTLDAKFTCEYRDLPDLIRLPGCIPLRGCDLLDPVQLRSDDCYPLLLHQCRKYLEADGIMVNSFPGMEPGPCQALQQQHIAVPVYPVGPLIRKSVPTVVDDDPTGCLGWLDVQPAGSVLYVSFGSGGVISHAQLEELALGLEMSRQRFLWVVRLPREGPADADYLGVRGDEDPLDFLPGGFLERTRGMGFVVPRWAPQVRILGHPSTGGFLSHCGWNSTLESMVHGVPMATWPLYAEQKMNAVVLANDVRVAIRVEGAGSGTLVRREELSRVARELMEGEKGKEVRRRAKAVAEAAKAALAGGGESSRALAQVARRCKAERTG